MEQIRIDRKAQGLRSRQRRRRDLAREDAASPLRYRVPDGAGDIDDGLLARIDAVLDGTATDEQASAHASGREDEAMA